MQKFRDSNIKSFEFSDLKGTHAITKDDFKSFNFQELNGEVFNKEKISDDTLRSERRFEKKNNFQIDSTVRDSRGLANQEKSDFEQKIETEVSRRLEIAYQDAYKEGLEKGREDGRVEAMAQFQEVLVQKVDNFGHIVETVSSQQNIIIEQNRHEIYEFIKRFTKWIVLKEINEKVYLEQLFEKLILEMTSRKNLIVKVGRANFAQMPEVVQAVEARLGNLTNIRVEIVPEIQHPGIILETENGLIDGSIEGVFQNIDKVFEQVVKHE